MNKNEIVKSVCGLCTGSCGVLNEGLHAGLKIFDRKRRPKAKRYINYLLQRSR